MSFRIIVDSCCDLSPSLLRAEPFTSVPLTLRIGDFTVTDDQTFDQADFLRRMKDSETAPRTACPKPPPKIGCKKKRGGPQKIGQQ